MKIRNKCPICHSRTSTFFCNLDNDFLFDSVKGWQHDRELMKKSGFNISSRIECSYYRCEKCKGYYLKHIYDIENGFQKFYKRNPKIYEENYKNRNKIKTKASHYRADSILRALQFAFDRSVGNSINVLDFGCGNSLDLSIMRSLQPATTVGYNPYSFPYDLAKKYIQNDIILLDDFEEVKNKGPYDFVRCNGVLEHVEEPEQALNQILSVLSDKGVVYFSAPNTSDAIMNKNKLLLESKKKVKILHPGHLQIWNFDGLNLADFVAQHGFKVIPLRRNRYISNPTNIKNVFKIIFWSFAFIGIGLMDYINIRLGRFKSQSFAAIKDRNDKSI